MTAKKIFYPVTDPTLPGLLLEVHNLLSGSIDDQDILCGATVDYDVVLNGLFPGTSDTLRGIADNFGRQESVRLQAGFVLVAQELLVQTIEEIRVTGGIMLAQDDIETIAGKTTSIDADIILNSIVSAALVKTAALCATTRVDGDVSLTVRALLSDITGRIVLGGNISRTESHAIIGDISTYLSLRHRDMTTIKETITSTHDATMRLLLSMSTKSRTDVSFSRASVTLSGAIRAICNRYRIIGDLQGMTLQDVQNWDLSKYYYMEV